MSFLGKLFGSDAKYRNIKRTNLEKRFRLHARIGQGSMSKVWRATDTKSGRTVCVKVLDKAKLALLLKRFVVGVKRPPEGQVAVGLDHPNVVKTYEWGVSTKGEEFLAMEFLEGVGFNFMIDTRARQLVGREFDLLIPIAEGIAYVHDKNFIHRDICPRNVMVTTAGVPKLIDFGLSLPNTPEFQRPGNRTGTANYMAPELIRRNPTDQRIDVFSFGVSVYEAFTGSLPWESTASLEAMLKHINSPPTDPRELRPDLDERVVAMLLKGIADDLTVRFPTMRHYIRVMQQLREAGVARGPAE